MTLSAIATTNSTIGPAQYADMAQALAPRFVVDGPTEMQPSYASGTVSITAGSALVAGTRVTATGTNTVAIPAVTSGSVTYVVVLRVNWSSATPTLVALASPVINPNTTANGSRVNRIPGVMYDAVLCTVTRTAGSSVGTIVDYRCWGGDGGPLRVSAGALDNPTWLDARSGTMIATDRGTYTKRLDNDGTWRAVGTDSNPWRMWTPTMRYYGNNIPNGTSGGTIATHGNGSQVSARYRVVDGMLDGHIYIWGGDTGALWGDGPVTIDLPMACASWQEDTWSQGHLYTTGYGGDGSYDWPAQLQVKRGWTRGMVWTHPRIDDNRLKPYVCQTPNGGPGTGVPYINGGYPVGSMTFHLAYPVTEV